jgi:hypothetical protein
LGACDSAGQLRTRADGRLHSTNAGAELYLFCIIGGVVVLDYETLVSVEHVHVILKPNFPYIPGLLAYREADAMMAACKKIRKDADVLLLDGFGANYPRRCGIATHIGLRPLPTASGSDASRNRRGWLASM